MKKRAIRRKGEVRAKTKAKKIMKESWNWDGELMDGKHVGVVASTHGKPCSCPMCGNPRRHFHEKTRQEIVAKMDEKDQNE